MEDMGIVSALTPLWTQTKNFLPNFVAALVILVIGYIIGRVVGYVVKEVLDRTNVDDYLEEQGDLKFELSAIFSTIGKWIIYLVFIQQAAMSLEVPAITQIVGKVVTWIPGLVGAVVVFLAGYGIAIYSKKQIIGSETLYSNILGKVVFFFVIYVAVATALPLVGIQAELLNNILLIIMGSVGAGFAIASGLGLKDIFHEEAERYIEEKR